MTYGIPILFSHSGNSTIAAVQTCLLVVVLTLVTYLVDPRCYVLYWLSLVLLQNVMAGFWHSGQADDIPFVVTEAKTLSLIAAVSLMGASIARLVRNSPWIGVGAVIYFSSLLLNVSDLSLSMLANMRNFVAPFLIVLVGIVAAERFSYCMRIEFVFVLLKFASFWLFIGAMGELIMGTLSWRNAFSVSSIGGLNSLAESTSLFGVSFSRTGGILFEPVNAGYIAASVLVVLIVIRYFLRYRAETLAWVLCFSGASVALLLAATKNALLMFAIVCVIWLFTRYLTGRSGVAVISAWIMSFLATLLYGTVVKGTGYLAGVWSNPIGVSGGESTSIHMAGLISGFKGLVSAPFGMGIGSGGNFYRLYNPEISREVWLGSGSESSWGTLAFQSGFLAILGFVVLILVLASKGGEATMVLIAVWSGASLFTEAFFGPIACSVLLLAAGLLWRDVGKTRRRSPSHLGVRRDLSPGLVAASREQGL
ncbi:UNVERIFIED_CONTAM: hypothetical protein RF653_12275 [Kocuria sp. CPCC 205316]